MLSFSLQTLYTLALACLLASAKSASVPTIKKRDTGFLKLDFSVAQVSKSSNSDVIVPIKRDGSVQAQLTNSFIGYFVELYIGSNKQKNSVMLDTGSADLWVFDTSISNSKLDTYDPSASKTSHRLPGRLKMAYSDGSNSEGDWYKDDISIGGANGPTSNVQFASCAEYSESSLYGVMGIGYPYNENMVAHGNDSVYPNYPQALKDQGLIHKNLYSLYLNSTTSVTGSILFGAIDKAKYNGDLVEFPSVGKRNRFNVQLGSLNYGNQNFNINHPAVLDSGYTYTTIAKDVLQKLAEQILGGKLGFIDDSKLFYSTKDCPTNAKHLKFNFDGLTIEIPSKYFLVASTEGCRLAIQAGNPKDSELSTVLGDNFLRHTYVVYNLDDRKLSIAPVKYTDESNIVVVK